MEDGIYTEAAEAILRVSVNILRQIAGLSEQQQFGDERDAMRQAPGKIPPLSADVHDILLCRRPGLALASLLWLGRRKCYEQPSPNRYLLLGSLGERSSRNQGASQAVPQCQKTVSILAKSAFAWNFLSAEHRCSGEICVLSAGESQVI